MGHPPFSSWVHSFLSESKLRSWENLPLRVWLILLSILFSKVAHVPGSNRIFFFHFYYLDLSAYVCVCARVNMCGGQRSVLDVFLYCPPPYLLRKSLRLKLVLADCRDWLVSQLGGCACLHPWPSAKVTAMHNLALSMGTGYLHSGPHAPVAGILPTEPSSQPPSF